MTSIRALVLSPQSGASARLDDGAHTSLPLDACCNRCQLVASRQRIRQRHLGNLEPLSNGAVKAAYPTNLSWLRQPRLPDYHDYGLYFSIRASLQLVEAHFNYTLYLCPSVYDSLAEEAVAYLSVSRSLSLSSGQLVVTAVCVPCLSQESRR